MDKPVDGAEARYLLVKRDLYYAPNNHGYTGVKAKAGRYMASEADAASGVTAIHEDDAPMFAKGCWEDIKTDHLLSIIAERERASAALVAENERLREALKPFADAAEYLDDAHKDRSDIWESPVALDINAGHLRAARTALETRNA